ncbi:unnamed protein product, partial [Effrenium voratum]
GGPAPPPDGGGAPPAGGPAPPPDAGPAPPQGSAAEQAEPQPIPGSEKWGITHNKDNTFKCGAAGKQYCCVRGSQYDAEQDICGPSKGHEEAPPSPQEEIEKFQLAQKTWRIPDGVDHDGVRGCTVKHAISCKDVLHMKRCCCNLGFKFDWATRECVDDSTDLTNKEDPIPGTQKWGLLHSKGAADK